MTDLVSATPTLENLLARIVALEAASAPAPVLAGAQHCWAPVLDHGGQVPVYMPVDPVAEPVRMIATTRGESMVLHFRCCRCPATGVRRFKAEKTVGHGGHHGHFDLIEVTSLPAGPCSGVTA